jgi:hypothetical protein
MRKSHTETEEQSKSKREYETFSDALKTVLSVPRSEMVAALAEEKARKVSKKAYRSLTEGLQASVAPEIRKRPKKRIAK